MSNRGFRQLFAATVLGVALTAASACAPPRGRVYVNAVPPPPIVEVRRAAPGPAYVWIDGYHRWNGRAYVWVPGRWAAKAAREGDVGERQVGQGTQGLLLR